jgi:hypothetical protein
VQVACTLAGHPAWISDLIDDSCHDTYCLNESGVLAGEPGNWMRDKGYAGNDMLTPITKPARRRPVGPGKGFNKQINKKSVTSSNGSSRTSKPGESCTLTICALWAFPRNHPDRYRTTFLQTGL